MSKLLIGSAVFAATMLMFFCVVVGVIIKMQWNETPPISRVENHQHINLNNPNARDPAEKVTRENFHKLSGHNRYFSEAQKLLGPARVDSQFGSSFSVSWRSRDGKCTIIATYDAVGDFGDGIMTGRTIFGD